MKYDEAQELVKAYHQDGGDLPATLYLPSEDYGELVDDNDNKNRTDNKIRGVPFEFDPIIKDPIILPDDFDKLPNFHTDPPEEKIRELVKVEKKEWEDTYRQTTNTRYETYVFLKPYCVWQRFDEDVIEKYGHPLSGPNINMAWSDHEPHEFTKTEFDYCKRQKFAVENRVTQELKEAGLEATYNDEEQIERELANSIHNFLWSVQVEPIYVERTWSYELPTAEVPTPSGEPMVIEHSEEIKIGEKYTTYESLLMKRVDINASKVEVV